MATGRCDGSRYAMVDRYTRPGNPCPNVPGIGATVSVFSAGAPNKLENVSNDEETSFDTACRRASGSGCEGGSCTEMASRLCWADIGRVGVSGRAAGLGCRATSNLRFPYTSTVKPGTEATTRS